MTKARSVPWAFVISRLKSYQTESESPEIFAGNGEVSLGIYKGLPISHVMNFQQLRI